MLMSLYISKLSEEPSSIWYVKTKFSQYSFRRAINNQTPKHRLVVDTMELMMPHVDFLGFMIGCRFNHGLGVIAFRPVFASYSISKFMVTFYEAFLFFRLRAQANCDELLFVRRVCFPAFAKRIHVFLVSVVPIPAICGQQELVA